MFKSIGLMLCFLVCSTVWAQGTAKVVLLKGEATFGGQPLKNNSSLKGNGEIVVGPKSYLKLLLEESQTQIVLGAETTSKINFSAPAEKFEVSLIKGLARWISGTKKGVGIKTSNAILGVRGTDFFTSFNPIFNETEVICFDGEVQISDALQPTDAKTIAKNQWGGIGGRFGKKVSEILTLTPETISSFDGALPK